MIDPTSEKVWEFTERDGLPTTRIDDPQEALRTPQYLRVAPLGPGRACVAGYFGRTWLAMATFDPQVGPVQGRSIKVFHEARDVGNEEDKTQWQSPSVAFQPAYMFALTDPAARDGKASQRVLIGRGGSTINVNHHPLLVDVDMLKVSVIADEGCWQEACAYEGSYDSTIAEGGAVYWAWPTRRRSEEPFAPTVYRMGFPDFKRETVMTRAHTGREATYRDRVFFHAGHFFIAARQWYVSDGPGKPFRMLRGDVPERMDIERLFRGPRATAPVTPEDTEAVVAVCKSNHYGLVCVSSIGRMYQVSFPGLSVH